MGELARVAVLGLLAGGVATALGAFPVAILPIPSSRARAVLNGFAGGVMLSAAVFSLAVPGLALRRELWGPSPGWLLVAALAFLAGAGLVEVLNRTVPHQHFIKGAEGPRGSLSRGWLFAFAMAVHNLPEGMALGVASSVAELSVPIAVAVALQNLPEGFVVAAALVEDGYRRSRAVLISCASGLVEPLGAFLAYGATRLSAALLPGALLFAAGAMIYVVACEVIPEAHRDHARAATWASLLGFALNMVLDALLT